jgi:hypothetical protein
VSDEIARLGLEVESKGFDEASEKSKKQTSESADKFNKTLGGGGAPQNGPSKLRDQFTDLVTSRPA